MFQLMSAPRARSALRLDQRTASFTSWQWDAFLKDSFVLVHQGDLRLSEDLVLDDSDWYLAVLRAHEVDIDTMKAEVGHTLVSGLVVEGGLTIEGALLNGNLESGAFVVVSGPFRARAVSGGGAEIRISGPAVVRDSVIGHYNDGSLHFLGGLETELLVNDDHDLFVGSPSKVGVSWSSHEDSQNELTRSHYEACNGDDAIADILPLPIAQRVSPDVDRWDRLKAALIAGDPVLYRGDLPRREPADPARIAAQWDRLRLVPEESQTDALCDAAIAASGFALIYCPRSLWTPARIKVAVERSPELLQGVVPVEMVTPEMTRTAATRLGFAALPSALQTDAILVDVLHAARDEPDMKTLADLPAKFVTAPVLAQIRSLYGDNPRYPALEAERARIAGRDPFYLLTDVWQAFLSEAEIIRGLKESGNAAAIHPSAMTPAVCDAMVSYRGSNLALIPREMITEAHVELALSRDGTYLAHVPEDMRTQERCLDAVKRSGLALDYVPVHLRSERMCELAIAEDGRALAYVPVHMRSESLCRRAVEHPYPPDLEHVPDEFRSLIEPVAREARAALLSKITDQSPTNDDPVRHVSANRMVLAALWNAMFSPSEAAVAAGARGWLSTRPALALVLGAILSLTMLVMHLALTVYAYTAEGGLDAALTLALPILAEGYWAWQFWPLKPALSVAIIAIVSAHVYVALSRHRLARRLAQQKAERRP